MFGGGGGSVFQSHENDCIIYFVLFVCVVKNHTAVLHNIFLSDIIIQFGTYIFYWCMRLDE